MQFFGPLNRDLGNPERFLSDNPNDIVEFIEACAKNKRKAFISVQPEKIKAKPCGIEKIFFDFDYCKNSEKLTQAETQKRKEELRVEVKHFLKHLNELNIRPLIIRTNRGFHVHVYMDSIYQIDDKLDFWKIVYKQLQTKLLEGYDYRFNDSVVMGDLKRMCRIPLSIHEVSGETCVIVNDRLEEDKIRSIEYFKLYGLKRKDIEAAIKTVKEIENVSEPKQINYVRKKLLIDNSDGIRPCFIHALDAGEMGHQQRLALLHEAYSIGFHSQESIVELYRSLNDFSYAVTRYQVNYFLTKRVAKDEVYRYRCETIQKFGWCLEDQCPKIKSPICSEELLENVNSDEEQALEEEQEEKCPECGSYYLEAVEFFDKRFKCSECGYEWEP